MINYVTGDATNPQGGGVKIITHVVNNEGGWGKGFVIPLARRYPTAGSSYRQWFQGGANLWDGAFELGNVQFVTVTCGSVADEVFNATIVANMVAQDGYRKRYDDPPKQYLKYDALLECLERVRDFAVPRNAFVHAPRFGAGLAGGDWNAIEKLINVALVANGVSVTIYDLPGI